HFLFLLSSLFESTCPEKYSHIIPELKLNPDINWQIASTLQPHVKKILDSRLKAITIKAKIYQANLYYKLAQYYQTASVNYKQALEYAKTSLEKRYELYENDHSAIADSLGITGIIEILSGNSQEALKYLKQGLEVR